MLELFKDRTKTWPDGLPVHLEPEAERHIIFFSIFMCLCTNLFLCLRSKRHLW